MLHVKNVSYRYHDENVLEDITVSVEKGEFFGVLGPNGSGKTTLLKLLSKELLLQSGEILLNGKLLSHYSQKELARTMAVLPQTVDGPLGYTLQETVELGRYAHQSSLFPKWTDDDERAVMDALKQVGLWEKRHKFTEHLSGGERQRVYLARALAQEPNILLLDEPTNHMDIAHQIKLLDTLKRWTAEKEMTVVAIFHDINLANLYCDRVLLLDKGKMIGVNNPGSLIEEETVTNVFDTPVIRHQHPALPKLLITYLPESSEVVGEPDDICEILTIKSDSEMIAVTATKPLKVLSSALVGAGFQWSTYFVNRHVPKSYHCENALEEMKQYLKTAGFDVYRTIGMMTAVYLEDAAFMYIKEHNFSLLSIVTAGVGNAVDVSQALDRVALVQGPGTINIMVFIDGKLSDAAYAQAMMTATEAKVKALFDEDIFDPETKTIATGTSTDCIAIAATQTNTFFEYAGTVTSIGRAIGLSVYEATREALQKYRKRVGERK